MEEENLGNAELERNFEEEVERWQKEELTFQHIKEISI